MEKAVVSQWTNTFRVGSFVCEMTYQPGKGLNAQWTPDVPRQLSADQWRQYRSGRDTLISEAMKALGLGAAIVLEV